MTGFVRIVLPLVAAFALGAATAAPPPGNVIRVKGMSGDTVLALVPTPGGGLVRLDVMARLLGGTLDSVTAGSWRLTLHGSALELREGVPFIGYNGFVLPLHESVQHLDGALHAPLQLFSEIVPRFGIGILWDKSRWEVRLFQSIARAATPPSPVTAAPMTPVTTASASAPPPREVTPTRSAAPTAAPAAPPAPAGPAGLSRVYTVAVDAGHGGRDPGNMGVVIDGRRVTEASLTLPMSARLADELKRRGLNVVMTRARDTLINLYDRGPLANAQRADLFVSIHTNAANPNWRNGSAVRGVETFFLSTARTEDEARVAAMENDVVRFEVETQAEKGNPLAFILNDLARNEHLRESFDFATVVQGKLASVHPGPDRGVKQSPLVVLSTAYMPAILVEVGFGTNLSDARWMSSAAGQRAVATSVADGIMEYLQHYERRRRAGAR
jgi:N-acetylmuramoyl-L-alanine amidase